MTRRLSDAARAWLVAGVAFVVYATYSVLRWWQLKTAGYDLGIFDQVVRAYARFQPPIVTLKGDGYNIWGDHFHPILALLAPLYWLWDDPRTLLIAQAALVASSVPVVFFFARRRMSARLATWVSIGYAFGWAIQTMMDFDFHEIAFGVPLLALAIDALDRRRDGVLLASAFALLFVREDLGMVVMLIGLVRVFRKPRWPGVVLLAVGPAAFVFVTKVVLPHFSPTGEFAYWAYDALGPDATSAIGYMLTNPIATLVLFFTPPVKALTFGLFFAPVLFLAFRSPYVLFAAPILAQRFFASRENLWLPYFHYNAPVWIIVTLAALDGFGRLPERWRPRLGVALASAMVIFSLGATLAMTPIAPFRQLLTGEMYQTTPLMRQQNALLSQIPANTCVAADDRLADRLVRTNRVTLPGISSSVPDFLALDLTQRTVGTTPTPYPRAVYVLAVQGGWDEVFRDGPLVLLRNPAYAGPRERCRP